MSKSQSSRTDWEGSRVRPWCLLLVILLKMMLFVNLGMTHVTLEATESERQGKYLPSQQPSPVKQQTPAMGRVMH